jgi:predicted aminopeptidase
MLQWENAVLVKTVFHELAHQQLYLPDDSSFNESFATAVADAGFARWRAETALGASTALASTHEKAFIALLLRYRATLQQLYASTLPAPDKLAAKARAIVALRQEFATLKRTWRDGERYATWLAEDLNNAKLASIDTYHVHVPAFLAILRMLQGDFSRFYRVAAALAKQPQITRETCLAATVTMHEDIPVSCAAAFQAAHANGAIAQAAPP